MSGKNNKSTRKPFNIGDRVCVISHRHGWCDGGLGGVVINRYGGEDGKRYQYTVDIDPPNCYFVEVEHTKDMRKL